MNSDEFEQQLRLRRKETPLPPEWRAQILQAAYAERAEVVAKMPTHRPWLTASRLRWSALAAVWLLIAGFHFAEPSTFQTTAIVPVPENPRQEQLWREQQRLLAELLELRPPVHEAPPAPPPSPRSGHRGRATQTILFI